MWSLRFDFFALPVDAHRFSHFLCLVCAEINRPFLFLVFPPSTANKAYTEAMKENQKFSVSRCYLVSSFWFVACSGGTRLRVQRWQRFNCPLTLSLCSDTNKKLFLFMLVFRRWIKRRLDWSACSLWPIWAASPLPLRKRSSWESNFPLL